MSAEAVQPINNFETNNRSHSRNTNRSKAKKSGSRVQKNLSGRRVDPGSPTPERLRKQDGVVKMAAGHYRAPPPMERLRDQNKLDPTPHINQAMYEAAEKLAGLFDGAGLGSGVAPQDLNRVVSGSGDPAHGMPTSERAAHCRQQIRLALKLMGWFEGAPHRGAGRLTIAVVCHEMGVKDAAAIHMPGGQDAARLAVGMDRLREGLLTLAVHWRLC